MTSLHLIARDQGPAQFGMHGCVVGAKDRSQVVSKPGESAPSLFSMCFEKNSIATGHDGMNLKSGTDHPKCDVQTKLIYIVLN